jgi:threonine/homoserine/homoserine lactone efflux protein
VHDHPVLGIHDFWLFAASGIVLTITPGPDTLYILGRSIAQGRRAGMLSVLGISTGILIHTAAAAECCCGLTRAIRAPRRRCRR